MQNVASTFTIRDERFYTYEDVGDLPRVTTILSAWPKDEHFYKWLRDNGQDAENIKNNAAESGTKVHELCGQLLEGKELVYNPAFITELEWKKIISFAAWYDEFKPDRIIANEKHVRSLKHGFAGTMDILAEKNGKIYILDIKSGKSIHDSYWAQIAAYAEAVKEMEGLKVDYLGIIHVGTTHKKGYNYLEEKNAPKHFKAFKSCQEMFNLQNPTLKSNHKTYPATVKLNNM